MDTADNDQGEPTYPSGEKFAEAETAAFSARVTMSLIPIPGVGTALGELLAAVFRMPVNRRIDRWAAYIEDRVRRLESERDIRVDQLAASDDFVTVLLHATPVALRTHQVEKHEKLRAAITHTALSDQPDIDQFLLFIRWIDELTVRQVKILHFIDDKRVAFRKFGPHRPDRPITVSREALLEAIMPQFSVRRPFYSQLGRDLVLRGLIDAGATHADWTYDDWYYRRTTALGRHFLWFISDPLPDPSTPADGS